MKFMSAPRRTAATGAAAVLVSLFAVAACSSGGPASSGAAASQPAAAGDTGTAASGGKTIDVSMTQFQGSFATLLIYVANRKGFFTDNGINAKIVQVANGTAASQAVLSGSVDMSTNSIYEILAAQSKGEDLQYIAGGVKGGFGEIVVAPDVTLPDEAKGFPDVLKDLKGKSIGVSSIGAGTYYELLFLLQQAGMTDKDVQIVPVGSQPSALAALKANRIYSFMAQEPVTSQLLADNDGKVVYSLGTGPNPPAGSENLMANGVVATTKWIQANPDAVKGVHAAIEQANQYVQGLDQAGALSLAKLLAPDLPGIPADVVAKGILNYHDHYDNGMAKAGIDIGNQQLLQAGVIKSAVPYDNVVNAIAQES